MVRVTATIQSARSTLEIQTFWPRMRKSSPSRRADVVISIALLPASGSVSARQNCDSPVGEARKDALLLLVGAVAGDGHAAEAGRRDVEEGAGGASGRAERLVRDGQLEHALPATAVLLRNGQTEPAAGGQVVVDLLREAMLLLAPRPVGVVVLGRDGGHAVTDGERGVGKLEVHNPDSTTVSIARLRARYWNCSCTMSSTSQVPSTRTIVSSTPLRACSGAVPSSRISLSVRV